MNAKKRDPIFDVAGRLVAPIAPFARLKQIFASSDAYRPRSKPLAKPQPKPKPSRKSVFVKTANERMPPKIR